MPIASGLPSIIKSIQKVSINVSGGNGSAAISSVDTSKAMIIPMGSSSLGASYSFASATQINAALGTGNGQSWVQIIEFI